MTTKGLIFIVLNNEPDFSEVASSSTTETLNSRPTGKEWSVFGS